MTSSDHEEGHDGPRIVDKRRIDPKTGEVRAGGKHRTTAETEEPKVTEPSEAEQVAEDAVADLKSQLEERTFDLQRLQAEYANYRKRVDRDRAAVREQSVATVLAELLPVLDSIGKARDHDELTGAFKSVGEALEAVTGKLGLERFGEKGEPFDPTVHEALMHSYSPDVTEATCVDILQPGYRIGDRILRPARVAVAEPGEPESDDEE